MQRHPWVRFSFHNGENHHSRIHATAIILVGSQKVFDYQSSPQYRNSQLSMNIKAWDLTEIPTGSLRMGLNAKGTVVMDGCTKGSPLHWKLLKPYAEVDSKATMVGFFKPLSRWRIWALYLSNPFHIGENALIQVVQIRGSPLITIRCQRLRSRPWTI